MTIIRGRIRRTGTRTTKEIAPNKFHINNFKLMEQGLKIMSADLLHTIFSKFSTCYVGEIINNKFNNIDQSEFFCFVFKVSVFFSIYSCKDRQNQPHKGWSRKGED